MSEKNKIVSLSEKSITMDAVMAILKHVGYYFPITPELRMNITYIIVLIAVNTVVVIVAALVGTEFLIRPAQEFCSAVKTYPFHSILFP